MMTECKTLGLLVAFYIFYLSLQRPWEHLQIHFSVRILVAEKNCSLLKTNFILLRKQLCGLFLLFLFCK